MKKDTLGKKEGMEREADLEVQHLSHNKLKSKTTSSR